MDALGAGFRPCWNRRTKPAFLDLKDEGKLFPPRAGHSFSLASMTLEIIDCIVMPFLYRLTNSISRVRAIKHGLSHTVLTLPLTSVSRSHVNLSLMVEWNLATTKGSFLVVVSVIGSSTSGNINDAGSDDRKFQPYDKVRVGRTKSIRIRRHVAIYSISSHFDRRFPI